MKIAAIFDLDDTLLTDASVKLFLQYLRKTGAVWRYFRRRDVVTVLAAITRYRLGLSDATAAMQRTASVAAGLELDAFWTLVEAWFRDSVIHAIAPAAEERLRWHTGQGHVPLICSAASQFSVRPVARHLGIDHWICTEWLSRDGRLTGEIRLPMAYGPGKVYWVDAWAGEQGVDLARSYFYTDHHSDRALLQRVGEPVVINPNRRLRRLAQRNGWPVEVWKTPHSGG